MEAVSVKNLIKIYRARERVYQAINDLSFNIADKERVCVRGAAGSGKSALLRLIAGIERPSAGEVCILGKPVHEMRVDSASAFRNMHIGIMMEDARFLPHLSVLDNVSVPLAARGISRGGRQKAAMKILKELGLEHAALSYPSRLSAYESQLASLGRALIGKPEILLLDEAAASLNERDTGHFEEALANVIKSGEYTVMEFTTTGKLTEADREITLEHGSIKEDTK